jgi:uncharacterized protein
MLETSYIVYQLHPYHANLNKRITKGSKLFFYDTGLLCYLLKITDAASVKTSNYKASIFENYVINEYIKYNYHNNLMVEYRFWRDTVGHEVDLIWQNTEKLHLIEIKASETIVPAMFKGLTYFENLLPDLIQTKTLVHTGLFNQSRTAANVQSWIHIELPKS